MSLDKTTILFLNFDTNSDFLNKNEGHSENRIRVLYPPTLYLCSLARLLGCLELAGITYKRHQLLSGKIPENYFRR